MNYIEERLKAKTENFREGYKYYQQWTLAKEYMPHVLQTISHSFPHYSLHDETHSETILNNIIKILGKDIIDNLSIIDLWLLLTSAYYHDLGMYVTAEDKKDLFCEGSSFVDYIKQKQDEKSSPMNIYAETLEIKEGKLYHKNDQLTVETIDAQRFLIADFIRGEHAERSEKKINESSSLNLLGNPIPKRIIRILGNICSAHTKSHEQLMKLPKVESSGCGTEDCHPLYIACLLRIGDLLDVDTNRLSDVLLSTLPMIPSDSLLYNQTNRDITHIRIDRSVIEMSAECNKYEVAELIHNWFKMIDDEFAFQTKNWYLIAPSNVFGSLPSVGKMSVELEGYDNFDGKNRPHFKIDGSKAIEMLQGAGLYSHSYQCIRELLQNSVDAIYLRIFKENPNITVKKINEECKKYSISIDLSKEKSDGDFSCWSFTLADEGIGMDKEDLKFLCNTGSSSQNHSRRKTIDRMPEWMKPSGTFGIGFQSVFLITDKVEMTTRKFGKEDTLSLVLHNPAGIEKGNILMKTESNEDMPYGTIIKFEIKIPKNSGWSVNEGEREAISVINTYDFIDGSLDVDAAKIRDVIYDFSIYSNVKLKLDGQLIEYAEHQSESFEYFDEETGLQVKLSKNDYTRVFYRNQEVSKHKCKICLLCFDINILHGNAKDILTLSRNEIRNEHKSTLQEKIDLTTCRYLLTLIKGERSKKDRQLISAYLEWHRDFIKKNMKYEEDNITEDWKDKKIKSDNGDSKEIKELLKYGYVVETVNIHSGGVLEFYNDDNDYFKPIAVSSIDGMSYSMYNLLCRKLFDSFPHISFTDKGIVLSKKQTLYYIKENDDTKKRWLKFYLHNNSNYSRGFMPCDSKYKKLEISGEFIDKTFHNFTDDYPKMVCPYIRKANSPNSLLSNYKLEYKVNDKVIDYVYENRKEESTTTNEIRACFEEFKNDFDHLVMEINGNRIEP